MQTVYNQWQSSFAWDSATALSPVPDVVEEGLVNGRVLARVGRSPALDYHAAVAAGRRVVHVRELGDRAWMVMSCNTENDLVLADAGFDLLENDSANIGTLLQKRGILTVLDDVSAEIKAALAEFDWPHDAAKGGSVLYHKRAFQPRFQ